jgi:hypothetical protein
MLIAHWSVKKLFSRVMKNIVTDVDVLNGKALSVHRLISLGTCFD